MSEENKDPAGPDLANGVPIADLAEDGMILGHVNAEAVLLARSGGKLFAVGAECTHYHGPLVEGVLVADTVRCPWHHACFSLRTGEAVRAPALSPVACWRGEERDGRIYVRVKLEPASLRRAAAGHRCGTGTARCPWQRSAAYPLSAHTRGQPGINRCGGERGSRGRHRGELHRSRGRGVIARPRARCARRRPRGAADGKRARPGSR